MRPEGSSIFISYCREDRSWAEWIGWQLEAYGEQVVLQAWDFRPGTNLVLEIDRAAKESSRTIVVLSGNYLKAESTDPEWASAFARDLQGRQRSLIPVRIESCEPRGLLGQTVLVDLVSLGEEEARGRLLAAIAGNRAKPQEMPVYPGPSPDFPGKEALFSPPPSYADQASRFLGEALQIAYRRLEEQTSSGQDVTEVRQEILELRRQIREGGQLRPGDILGDGRFRLLELAGRGGFASVFKTYDRNLRQLVAVKALHSQYAQDRSRRERFFRGARKMAELQHQNIVRVIDPKLEDGGFQFFVMEHVDGGDLYRAVLEGRLDGRKGLEVICQIAEALEFAHQSGVIHRDIKPANILLTAAGVPKLTDFDLVRAADTTGGTRTGSILGTFLYLAPEAMEQPKGVTVAAEVYALAMTTAFLFHGRELPSTVLRNPSTFFAGLDCPKAMKDVLKTATAWQPRERFPSVRSFAEALAESARSQEKSRPKGSDSMGTPNEGTRLEPAPAPKPGEKFKTKLPGTVSLETQDGIATPLLRRGASIPQTLKKIFSTSEDDQESIGFHLVLGENEKVKDNTSLGRFHLQQIPPEPKGVPQIEVSIEIDRNLQIEVFAKHLGNGRKEFIGKVDLTAFEIPPITEPLPPPPSETPDTRPLGDFSDLLGDLFGFGDSKAKTKSTPGDDLQNELPLSFEGAALGAEVEHKYFRSEICEPCKGTGQEGGGLPDCKQCLGRGKVRVNQGFFSVATACQACEGAGKIITRKCDVCSGKGNCRVERSLQITVPAGVDNGMRLRLRGEGGHGSGGGPPGKLDLVIVVAPHKDWERKGVDVYQRRPIELEYEQLLQGTSVELDTLHGREKIKIPAGTKPGTQFRLRGHGVQELNKTKRGDHLVQIGLKFPSAEEAQS